MVSEKEAEGQSTQGSVSCYSHVLHHRLHCIALKKQCTKKNEEATEYCKLLAKRVKEAGKKKPETGCQDVEAILAESFTLYF